MHKIILTTLLVVMSSSAAAAWVRVDESPSIGYTYYADPTTVRKNGIIAVMWDMTDLAKAELLPGVPGDKPIGSYKQHSEYNCKEKLTRRVAGTAYSGKLGGGKELMVYEKKDSEWEPIVAGDVNNKFFDIACKK
ncbi:MAG: hypothetical protein NT123_21780 [Proteobacteria bacterium]|nr:hypothetical protein [Pseudomonadota bacterium]